MKRPKPVHAGRVHARVIRGPDDRGRWYWRAETRIDGEKRTVWTGWGSPDDVAKEIAAIVADGREGERRSSTDEIVTVKDLLECWQGSRDELVEAGRLRPKSAESSEDGAERIVAVIGSVRIDRLTRDVVERFANGCLVRGAAHSTVRLDVGYLGAAWRWAREIGHAPDRDFPRVSVKVPKKRRYRPTPAHAAKLIEELELSAPVWVARVMRLLAALGCRRDEVARLRRRDLDLVAGVVQVDGKTGPRDVPLHPKVLAIVRSWDLPEDPDAGIWGVSASTIASSLWRYYGPTCDELGLPRITPRTLRRLFVDQLYRAGAEPKVAGTVAGHSERTAFEHYREAADEDLRAAIEAFDPVSPPQRVVDLGARRTRPGHKRAKVEDGRG
jgi:integrase